MAAENDARTVDDAVRLRLRERLHEQARDGIARLESAPSDPVGRGLLGDAADKLVDPEPWVLEARDRLLVPARPVLPIRTERLVLRQVTMEDADDVFAYVGRDDVATYLLSPAMPRDEVQSELRRRIGLNQLGADQEKGPPHALGLVMELEGRVIGDVVMIFKPPTWSQAEIGWVVHPDFGGRGLVTEAARALLDLAFGHYGFHRVSAELDARNEASARVCERLGMRRELVGRKDYWVKGQWTDTYRYALLADEHTQMTGYPQSSGH